MIASRRGGVLLGVLVLSLVVQVLLVALVAVVQGRARLVLAERAAIEAQLVARSVLAEGRVHFATVAALPDGEAATLDGEYPGDWQWTLQAVRRGALIVLRADVGRQAAPGRPLAGTTATAVLHRAGGDTLRRLLGW